jgi:WD40 repeat protein
MLRRFIKRTAIPPFLVLIIGSLALGIACSWATSVKGGRKPALVEIRVDRLPASILSLDVAPGSDLAAAALSDGCVRIWHLDTGGVVHEFGFREPETDARQKDEREVEPIRVRFAPDGKALGVSHLSRIHLYQVGTWSETLTLGVEGEDVMRPVPGPQLSERPLVEKEPDDINTGTKKWEQRKMLGDGRTRITDFAFTPDGTAIVVSYCRISCYDMPSGVRWMISNGHEPVRLWELGTGRMAWEHYSGPNRITDRVVPTPDGKLLVEVVFRPGHWDLQVMDIATGKESHSIALSAIPDQPDVVFTPDSHRFVSLWQEPYKMWQMALFDTASGQVLAHFTDFAGAQRVAISANGKWLAITTWRDKAFKLWDLAQRKPLVTMKPKQAGGRVSSLHVRFTSDDRRVVVSDQRNGLVFIYAITD